jgi:sulfide:quinone oxidoreductase
MDEKKIAPDYGVSGQITPEQVKEVRARGYRSIMCNRPDDEQPGQPRFAEIEAAAREAGIAVAWVPVVSGAITEEDVEAFRKALAELPGPVFAYCRSGTRSQNLWVMSR